MTPAPENPPALDNARRNAIAGLPALVDDPRGDNVAIALATYFSHHPDRPADDKDGELGWGEWVMAQTNSAIDRIYTAAVEDAARRYLQKPTP